MKYNLRTLKKMQLWLWMKILLSQEKFCPLRVKSIIYQHHLKNKIKKIVYCHNFACYFILVKKDSYNDTFQNCIVSFVWSPLVNTMTCFFPLIVVSILLPSMDGGHSDPSWLSNSITYTKIIYQQIYFIYFLTRFHIL